MAYLEVIYKNGSRKEVPLPLETSGEQDQKIAYATYTQDAGLFQRMAKGVSCVLVKNSAGEQIGYVGPPDEDDPGNFD